MMLLFNETQNLFPLFIFLATDAFAAVIIVVEWEVVIACVEQHNFLRSIKKMPFSLSRYQLFVLSTSTFSFFSSSELGQLIVFCSLCFIAMRCSVRFLIRFENAKTECLLVGLTFPYEIFFLS